MANGTVSLVTVNDRKVLLETGRSTNPDTELQQIRGKSF